MNARYLSVAALTLASAPLALFACGQRQNETSTADGGHAVGGGL